MGLIKEINWPFIVFDIFLFLFIGFFTNILVGDIVENRIKDRLKAANNSLSFTLKDLKKRRDEIMLIILAVILGFRIIHYIIYRDTNLYEGNIISFILSTIVILVGTVFVSQKILLEFVFAAKIKKYYS